VNQRWQLQNQKREHDQINEINTRINLLINEKLQTVHN